jgi:hypothetical protein
LKSKYIESVEGVCWQQEEKKGKKETAKESSCVSFEFLCWLLLKCGQRLEVVSLKQKRMESSAFF